MIWVQQIKIYRKRMCLICPWVTADLISNSPSGLQIYSSQLGRRTFTFSQTLSALFQALLLMLLPFLDFWRITRKFQGKSKILHPAGMYFINYFDIVQVTRFSKAQIGFVESLLQLTSMCTTWPCSLGAHLTRHSKWRACSQDGSIYYPCSQ